MRVRGFKQFFTVAFALLLGAVGLTTGLFFKTSIEGMPESLSPRNWLAPFANVVWELHRLYPFYLRFTTGALFVLGVLLGAIVGPKLGDGIVSAGNAIERMSSRDKIALGCGSFLGAVATAPFILLLLRIPVAVGIPLGLLLGVAFIYLGVRGTMSMKDEFRFIGPTRDGAAAVIPMEDCKILDTNVIIDGRIVDICRTRFIQGTIYVPGFVLDELQHIADSSDSLKRARGRRGLDILQGMQKEFPLVVRSYDHKLGSDRGAGQEVDTRLVTLAKNMGGTIVTNDYNLNKVAALQGVTVLNVNDLALALKPVVLPGEEMQVTIIKEGKEPNQGVAYLDDGTMIVVEDGRRHIAENMAVVVTSVLQTVAGKMIFARSKGSDSGTGDDQGDGGRGRAGGGQRYKVR